MAILRHKERESHAPNGHLQFYLKSAQAVLSAVSQFEELKRTVDLWLVDNPHDRGYCNPSEDDAIRGLLVTYWQIRIAILEMVYELRDHWYREKRMPPIGFLAGFAGGIVLLDAARYLREKFHHRPTYRDKLNEEEPIFGIPPGLYEATQKSWTSGRQLWQLFDAAKYYAMHRQKWIEESSDQSMESGAVSENELRLKLIHQIDRLSSRLSIQFRDYAKFRFRCRLRSLWSTWFRFPALRSLFQLQKVAGILAADKYLYPFHQPAIPESIKNELKSLLSPGDVLLVRKEYALTNYFLPGYWPHTAFYIGNAEQRLTIGIDETTSMMSSNRIMEMIDPESCQVIEAMKDGVRLRNLQSPMQCDSFLVLRPLINRSSLKQAILRAMHHVGKEYDFSFDFTSSTRLVCTEVIYRALDGLDGINLPLRWRVGRLTIAAEDFVSLALNQKCFEIQAAYIPTYRSCLLSSDEAMPIVKKLASEPSVISN